MRRLLVACVVLVAGVLVSLAVGAPGGATAGRWVIRDLGTLGGPASGSGAINERGQIIGGADKARHEESWRFRHAFLWQNGKMRDLGTLGGPSSCAAAINNRGQIAGGADTTPAKDRDGDAYHHAFLWQNGRMRDLGSLKGSPGSTAYDMNDRGQVIGVADTTGLEEVLGSVMRMHRAFLWQKRQDARPRHVGWPGKQPGCDQQPRHDLARAG